MGLLGTKERPFQSNYTAPTVTPLTPEQIAALQQQIQQSWGTAGDWNSGGVDRSAELAQILGRAGISDISQLGLKEAGEATRSALAGNKLGMMLPKEKQYQLTYGDQALGYLDKAGKGEIQQYLGKNGFGGTNLAYSASGDGGVNYKAVQGPDGKVSIVPVWQDSNDMTSNLQAALLAGGALLGGAALANGGLFGGGGVALDPTGLAAGEFSLGGGASSGIGGALGSADKAALFGNSGYGAGMSGAQTAAYDGILGVTGSGGLANAGANAASGLQSLGSYAGTAAQWMKDNPVLGRLLAGAAGGLLGGVGGTSGGGSAPYTGPMPTIKRGSWQPSATPAYMAPVNYGQMPTVAPTNSNNGLQRYLLGA